MASAQATAGGTDILARILETKKEEVAALKSGGGASTAGFEARIRDLDSPALDFAGALREASKTGYGLIAEIKKASPSRGVIREDFDPPSLARAYAEGGAACLSVLTDGTYFQGHLDYLAAARAASGLPVLRKDFMIDPLQVHEARAAGADAILVIMAAVDDALARELEDAAHGLGMAVLLEVHDRHELDRALRLSSPLLGVNSRDLRTMETDLATAEAMLADFPAGRTAVAESGLETPGDLARMARAGARCFLVGESLMRQDDVAAATRTILADPLHGAGGQGKGGCA